MYSMLGPVCVCAICSYPTSPYKAVVPMLYILSIGFETAFITCVCENCYGNLHDTKDQAHT
jgi:hypothetical protein